MIEIKDILNKAYSIEIGDVGIAFRNPSNRIESTDELEMSIPNIYLIRNDTAKEIIALVEAKVENGIVWIRLFATKLKFQVIFCKII